MSVCISAFTSISTFVFVHVHAYLHVNHYCQTCICSYVYNLVAAAPSPSRFDGSDFCSPAPESAVHKEVRSFKPIRRISPAHRKRTLLIFNSCRQLLMRSKYDFQLKPRVKSPSLTLSRSHSLSVFLSMSRLHSISTYMPVCLYISICPSIYISFSSACRCTCENRKYNCTGKHKWVRT